MTSNVNVKVIYVRQLRYRNAVMKYALALLFSLFPISLCAQTVIYYEDGSVYTVQPNEHVYVETARKMFTKKGYKNGNEYFTFTEPSDKVDYQPEPYDGLEEGSPEWCEAYAPFLYANGYTFDDQLYIRSCGN